MKLDTVSISEHQMVNKQIIVSGDCFVEGYTNIKQWTEMFKIWSE